MADLTRAALNVGDAAPEFALPTDGGGTVNLASLRGRKVALYFYPKDDTSGCSVEAREFNDLRADFDDAGTVVLGVSPDDVKSHDKFKAKLGLSFALVSDAAKSTLQAYGVWAEKSMYGRKYMGVERTTFLIDVEGRIARVWRQVRPAGHAAEVLAAARAT